MLGEGLGASLPHPEQHVAALTTSKSLPSSPTKGTTVNLIPQLLLSSTLQAEGIETDPPSEEGKLQAIRHPLSIPMTTVNLSQFVAKVDPINWFQVRVEENLIGAVSDLNDAFMLLPLVLPFIPLSSVGYHLLIYRTLPDPLRPFLSP